MDMVLVQYHQAVPDHHFVHRAWNVRAGPLELALTMITASAGDGHGGSANHRAGDALALVALTAPAAAASMALLAERAREDSAGLALAVSTLLGVLVFLALPPAVVSGEGVLVTTGVCVVGIAVAGFVTSRTVHVEGGPRWTWVEG